MDYSQQDSSREDIPEPPKKDPDEAERSAKFQMLREHFKSVRRQSQSPSHEGDVKRREDTLDQGILQNVS